MLLRTCLLLTLLCVSTCTYAVEYVSVSNQDVRLYDAPSVQAKKRGRVSGAMPYEVVVTLKGWLKVRDLDGKMYWLESGNVTSKRTVLVTTAAADVFELPAFASRLLFRVTQDVTLEWLETTGTGWVKIRHADGDVGYIRSEEVWGE
jgi:SH3-like domain-containing protein